MLCKAGAPVTLMDPHKPNREDEKKRIEDSAGVVVWYGAWRVNGVLSVARAIGDRKLKQWVIGRPDIAEFDLDGTEEYLVLGCDGLWDVMTPEKAMPAPARPALTPAGGGTDRRVEGAARPRRRQGLPRPRAGLHDRRRAWPSTWSHSASTTPPPATTSPSLSARCRTPSPRCPPSRMIAVVDARSVCEIPRLDAATTQPKRR